MNYSKLFNQSLLSPLSQGYHCVLRLTTSCLAKPKVSSLRPIIITLSPHSKTIRVKTSGGRIPACFVKEVLGQESISAVKDKIRHVQKVMMASSTASSTSTLTHSLSLTSVHECKFVLIFYGTCTFLKSRNRQATSANWLGPEGYKL